MHNFSFLRVLRALFAIAIIVVGLVYLLQAERSVYTIVGSVLLSLTGAFVFIADPGTRRGDYIRYTFFPWMPLLYSIFVSALMYKSGSTHGSFGGEFVLIPFVMMLGIFFSGMLYRRRTKA